MNMKLVVSMALGFVAFMTTERTSSANSWSYICLSGWVETGPWQPWSCGSVSAGDTATAGTTGQSKMLKAIALQASGLSSGPSPGGCLRAHIQDIGWTDVTCFNADGAVHVGDIYSGLRIEALAIMFYGEFTKARGHVQNLGWQPWAYAAPGEWATIGTTGQSLRLEEVEIGISDLAYYYP